MSFNHKWAVILLSSILISAISTSPSLLPLEHSGHPHYSSEPLHDHHHHDHHEHDHYASKPLLVTPLPPIHDHHPKPTYPSKQVLEEILNTAYPAKGNDHHLHDTKHPLPLIHDPHKHDHHHHHKPYVSKHSVSDHLPSTGLINEISKIAVIEKSRPIKSGTLVEMYDPYLVAHKSGPPYLTQDPIPLIHGNHNLASHLEKDLLGTKHVLDPPNGALLNEISHITHLENPRLMKSMPLTLKDPHGFKHYVGSQNGLHPPPKFPNFPENVLVENPHLANSLPLIDNHDPDLISNVPLLDGDGFHNLHHDHYGHYVSKSCIRTQN